MVIMLVTFYFMRIYNMFFSNFVEQMAIIDFMCDINAVPGDPKNQPVVASYSVRIFF